jgi:hypothetical protein
LSAALLIATASVAPTSPQGDPMTEFATGMVEANGITFHHLEVGTGPVVLALRV